MDSPRGPGRTAGPDPGRPDGRLAVRVPARHRGRDGRGRRAPAGDRHHAGGLRRLPPGQLRLLRLAGARPGDRPQRLRRGPSRRAGSGTCAGWSRASGSPAGRTARPRSTARPRRAPASGAYRDEVGHLADQPLLARSYQRLDVDRLERGRRAAPSCGAEIGRSARKARQRTSDRALPRFTEEVDGRRRIVEEPPLITRLADAEPELLAAALDEYLLTLAPHWRRVARRLHARRHRAQGGRRRQRRAARLRRAAGGPHARTTWCSCSSSRPAGRCWPATCTASRPGTPTRASGSSSTSRRCRR